MSFITFVNTMLLHEYYLCARVIIVRVIFYTYNYSYVYYKHFFSYVRENNICHVFVRSMFLIGASIIIRVINFLKIYQCT